MRFLTAYARQACLTVLGIGTALWVLESLANPVWWIGTPLILLLRWALLRWEAGS